METITNLTAQDFINLYQALAQYVGLDWLYAAALLSLALMAIRKWRLDKKANSWLTGERVMNLLVLVAAYGEAAGDFLLHTPTANPGLLLVQGAIQRGLMQNLYVFVFKPYVPRLWAGFKAWVNSRKSLQQARELVAAKAAGTPAVPATLDIRQAGAGSYQSPSGEQVQL